MKRLYLILLACTFILCLVACYPQFDDNPEVTSAHIDSTQPDDESSSVPEIIDPIQYIIRDEDLRVAIKTVNENASQYRNITVEGIRYDLTYSYTRSCKYDNMRYDVYSIDGEDLGFVAFSPDGELREVSFEFSTIEVSPQDTAEEIIPKIKPILNNFIDLSQYEYVKDGRNRYNDGFGECWITFYNTIDGYFSNSVSIYVRHTGEVYRIKIDDMPKEIDEFVINKEKEKELLEHYFEQLYLNDGLSLDSYNYISEPAIVLYEQDDHILYSVETKYKDENGNIQAKLEEVLIPIWLIKK